MDDELASSRQFIIEPYFIRPNRSPGIMAEWPFIHFGTMDHRRDRCKDHVCWRQLARVAGDDDSGGTPVSVDRDDCVKD